MDHALSGLLVAKVKAQAGSSVHLVTVDLPPLISWSISKEHERIITLAYATYVKCN